MPEEVAVFFIKASNLIKEAKKEPEAPSWAPFGEFIWKNHREGFKDKEIEKTIEKEIYQDLKKHFANNRSGIPEKTSAILSMCVELGWYKRILHPPPHKTLYRGLKIKNKKELEKLIDKTDIEDEGSVTFQEEKHLPIENGFSTSWSYKKQVSKDFSDVGKKGYAVTIYANVSDNKNKFLAGPGGLYDVDGLSQYHLEKETVGLEPINIKKIEWKKL